MHPDWAFNLGPRDPSAIIIILSPRLSILINERVDDIAFLKLDPRITE
jgi:hypothetical protein